MKLSPLLVLAAFGLLDVCASAQGAGPDVLTRIRSVFQSTDTNGDGQLGVAEARLKGIPAADFAIQDADKSGSLSADEFYVYYRQLLSKAGRPVPTSLEREVARVVAARKAAASGERPGATPTEKPAEKPAAKPAAKPLEKPTPEKPAVEPAGKPADVNQPGDDPARRAQQLVKRLVDGGSVSAEEGRNLYTALVSPASAAGDVTALGNIRSALNQTRARVGSLVQSGSLSAGEARELSAFFEERASSAAQALSAAKKSAAAKQAEAQPKTPEENPSELKPAAPVTVAAPIEAPPASSDLVPDAAPNTRARRAQLLVKRLVDGGSLSAAQGREMFAALVDPATLKSDPKALGEIRTAVNSARMRLGSLEQAGKLDAAEARLLSELFNARGSAVAQALVAVRGERASGRDQGDLSARQAHSVVRRLAARGELNEAEDRAMTLALTDPASLTGGAEDLVKLRQAVTDSQLRVTALVQSGKLSVVEGRSLSMWFHRRATQAAKAIEASVPGSGSVEKTPEKAPEKAPEVRQTPDQAPKEAPGEDLTRRAQKLVKGLIDQGRIGAAEGREMFQAMTDPTMFGGDPTQLAGLRAALDRVRPRIGQLVNQGHLTAQEGRRLSALFDARATAAAAAAKQPARSPERDPAKEPVREPKQRNGAKKKPAGERGQPGASKTPKVKNAGTRPAKGSGERPAKKGDTPKKKKSDGRERGGR